MYSVTTILGRLTATPELRQTTNGVDVASFSVAVDRAYTPKGQERETDFYTVVAWRGTGSFVCNYFSKGDPILVQGTMQARKYTDKNGTERTVWELIADRVSFTGSKGTGGTEPTKSKANENGQDVLSDFAEIEDDGDLPFN